MSTTRLRLPRNGAHLDQAVLACREKLLPVRHPLHRRDTALARQVKVEALALGRLGLCFADVGPRPLAVVAGGDVRAINLPRTQKAHERHRERQDATHQPHQSMEGVGDKRKVSLLRASPSPTIK